MKKSILCLMAALCLLGTTALAAEERAEVYVGGVGLVSGQYLDIAGNVSQAEPEEGGYAYYEDGVLTLSGYTYEGEGYAWEEMDDGGELYTTSAVICAWSPLTIQAEGYSYLKNTSDAYFADGIWLEGDLLITGGTVAIDAPGDGIFTPNENVAIEDSEVYIISGESGINAGGGAAVTGSSFYVETDGDGIYVFDGDLKITDSDLTITAGLSGIYLYNGSLDIGCTKVEPFWAGGTFTGTKLKVNAGEYAAKADMGGLRISDRLTISAPEGGTVKTVETMYDSDGDDVDDTEYTYGTIVDQSGGAVQSFEIEPLICDVTPNGLDMGFSVAFPVPVGQSLNEVYGDEFDPYREPVRKGYTFLGWYTDEGGTEGCEYSFDTPVTCDIEIYAKWGEEEEGGPSKPAIRPGPDEETEEKPPLVDVAEDAWYAEAVRYVSEKGIMEGTPDGVFSPEGGVNRAMMAEALWRMEGCPVVNYAMDFADVREGQWYTEAIRWAASTGMMVGYGNGEFGTGDELTREQLAVLLYRREQSVGGGFTGSWMFLLDCADRAEISSWAYEAMCWMDMHGILLGKGEYMAPQDMVTRAEAAQVLMRYLEK